MKQHNPTQRATMAMYIPATTPPTTSTSVRIRVCEGGGGSLITRFSTDASRRRFFNAKTLDITIDTAAESALLHRMGLSTKNKVRPFTRFIQGNFELEADAPDASDAGSIGEMLTFLRALQLCNDGHLDTVVRVVSYTPSTSSPTPKKKKSRTKKTERLYPMPDFLTRRGGKSGCLEVKSTVALNYANISSSRPTASINICANVEPLRKNSLEQLGRKPTTKKALTHNLILKPDTSITPINGAPSTNNQSVPFPCDFASACIVCLTDGRIKNISQISHSTPKHCSKKGQDCIHCIGRTSTNTLPAPTLTWLDNSPDHFNWNSSSGFAAKFIQDYDRWQQAIWTRHPEIASATSSRLHQTITDWHLTTQEANRAHLLTFWTEYIEHTMSSRGLQTIPTGAGGITERISAPDEPPAELVDLERFRSLAEDAKLIESEIVRRFGTKASAADEPGYAIATIGQRRLEYRFCGSAWTQKTSYKEAEDATKLIREFTSIAFDSIVDGITLLPIDIQLGDSPIRLGWKATISGLVRAAIPASSTHIPAAIDYFIHYIDRLTILHDGRLVFDLT